MDGNLLFTYLIIIVDALIVALPLIMDLNNITAIKFIDSILMNHELLD